MVEAFDRDSAQDELLVLGARRLTGSTLIGAIIMVLEAAYSVLPDDFGRPPAN